MSTLPPSPTVLERCTIQPPPHTPELTLPLLHFDITWLYFHPVHRLLFFHLHSSKSHFLQSILPQIKHSLTQTLFHFPPLAGKIVLPLSSAPPFARFSPGDSLTLTVAESDRDFSHLTANHPRLADDFYACVPHLPPPKHSSDDDVFSVLALQITIFPDHGVCLGFTNHHAIADASSVVQFIKAWAAVNKHALQNKNLLRTFFNAFKDANLCF